MGWTDVTPPFKHKCDKLPEAWKTTKNPGTILECDECGAQYKLTSNYDVRDGNWMSWVRINAT